MNQQPKKMFTPEEYLALERAAEFRSEFFNGEIFAMAGGSFEHARIIGNLSGELHGLLQDGPCQVLASDMRVKVSVSGLYTYPDLVAFCGEPELEDQDMDTLLNPQLIVEVLSPSSERYDQVRKFDLYSTIPSLTEYIIVAQDRPTILHYVREPKATWKLEFIRGLDSVLRLSLVEAEIRLQKIYARIEFPPDGGTLRPASV